MIKRLDNLFRMNIDRLPPNGKVELPDKLWPFIWYFARQVKGQLALIASMELALAVSVSLSFWYVGELVRSENYTAAVMLAGGLILFLRLIGEFLLHALYDLLYVPHFGNMIRRQLFWYVSRHSLSFYQNDFAGRIGNKLIQSAPSLRDAVKSTIGAVWFALVFTVTNLWIVSSLNIWLAMPLYIWLAVYVVVLFIFVPQVKDRSMEHAEHMSQLTGQIVDIFTNFMLTKYFARLKTEDAVVIQLLNNHGESLRRSWIKVLQMAFVLEIMNFLLIAGTAFIGLHLYNTGAIDAAALAVAIPMMLQATFQSGWIMFEATSIFENLGAVQEGIEALSKPHTVVDKPKAKELVVKGKAASVRYTDVHFHYDRKDGPKVLEGFNLSIPAGQKVGVVGRSGAGKSTLTSLLVRAYDVESGAVNIAEQNIAEVSQDSLRRAITVVTQESYLFHRSVLDNIRYGKPDATLDEVIESARAASAHDFIQDLSDMKERMGYEAHVGERGVKLSGGQKQRIAIARAILKDAPILVLDEATSALDSESEQAIQTALETVMQGKTVIAIAHRLSTLRQMDRIIVMDKGQIVEDGSHDELVKAKGIYADLWNHQTGGYLPKDSA